jgi:hypothetical protein
LRLRVDHMEKGEDLQEIVTNATGAEKSLELPGAAGPVSPLGWSIRGRLLCAAGASVLLWLAVAWALGWLS